MVNIKAETRSTNDEFIEAARRATGELGTLCTCDGVAAVAMIVAVHAESIASAMGEGGMNATAEGIAKAISTRSARIARRIPAPPIH